MTANLDFDDIARAWLDLMPREAPDHAIDAVLDAVAATPQMRRLARPPFWRPISMNRSFVAIAAAAFVVVAGAIVVTRPPNQSTNGASPAAQSSAASPGSAAPPSTPPASASGPLNGSAVPAALRHQWMGGTDSLVGAGTGSTLVIGAEGIAMAQANTANLPVLTASAVATAAGQLRLSSAGAAARCAVDQAGTYTWSLSSSGRSLSVDTADDPCTSRVGAVRGTWWLMGCKDATDNCLGDLDAGTYKSQSVNFAQPGGTSWTPEFGAVTYTVPDGWANDADWPTWLGLASRAAYAQFTPTNGTPEGIAIDPDAHPEDQVRACSDAPATVAQQPAAVLAYLRSSAPGLVVGPSTAITVDGQAGLYADLSLKDADVRPCGADRVVEYLVNGKDPQPNTQAVEPGHRNRLILAPGPSGLVAIVVGAETARFDAVVAEAMPIIASLHFR